MSHTSPQPEPVVTVSVHGDRVTVDGQLVEHDGSRPSHDLAIETVAERFARPLQRPVRVVASDESGQMGMVVHPDGHTSDLAPITAAAPGGHASDDTLPRAPHRPDAPSPSSPERDGDATPVEAPLALITQTPFHQAGQAGDGDALSAGEADTPQTPPVPDAPRTPPVSDTPPLTVSPEPAASTPQGPPMTAAPEPSTEAAQVSKESPAPLTRAEARAAQRNRSFLTQNGGEQPPETGWQGFLRKLGLRSGPSAQELADSEDIRAISKHWPGPRTIAVVNGKGGANKTPTTVLLAALFARHGGSGVLAWDNNETRGTLGWRTEQGPHQSHVLDLAPRAEELMQPNARAADLAAFVHHQTKDKYDVLRSNPLMLPHQQRLTAADFDAVYDVATKYFRLIVIDSGNDETAPHWLEMIDRADQIVVATTTRPDHAEAGRLLLEALRDRDEHSVGLADNAVVVVSQADREEASADQIAAGYDGIARAAVTLPYDKAMRSPWLRYDLLQPATQRAARRAAATVAQGL